MKLADWLDALTHKLIHQNDPTLGSVPVGMLASFPLGVPDDNWLLCTGATFDAAVYPALAAYLGGNTLPDYKGMVLVMQDAGQSEFDTLGETGGAKTVTLIEAQLASHNHTQNAHGHTQNSHDHPVTVNTSFGSTGTNNNNTGSTEPPNHDHLVVINAVETGAADLGGTNRWVGAAFAGTTYAGPGKAVTAGVNAGIAHTHTLNNHSHNRDHDHSGFTDGATATTQNFTATNNAAGSGSAHQNMPPYKVVNVAIRAK